MPEWPPGYARIFLKTVDSTQLEARRRIALLSGPTWIASEEQTAGFGRRGRHWSTECGNFAATLVQPVTQPFDQTALLSFVTALALRDTFLALGGKADQFQLKWPNDVLFEGGKIAGILLETMGEGPSHLAIGIGVNTHTAPRTDVLEKDAIQPKSLAEDASIFVQSEIFLTVLATAYNTRQTQFIQNGFPAIRQAWLDHAAHLGQIITARLPKETLKGRFQTMDETGALVLDTDTGLRPISAAEIFLGDT